MPTPTDARDRAAKTAMKDERAKDAARAMREYEAERQAVVAKTARLRALRLAKEAEGRAAAPPVKAKKSPKEKR